MALLWDTTIRGLFINRGIKLAMSVTVAVTIYKGIQPTASDIIANWPAYKSGSTDFLCHYSGSVWTQQPAHGQLLGMSTPPTATSVVQQTGEATWAILWMTDPLLAAVEGDTLPGANFIVIPCSNTVGKGVIRYEDPLLVIGEVKIITEASLSAVF